MPLTPEEFVHLTVSKHAVKRFVQRGGARSHGRAEADLLRMAAEGKEFHPPPLEAVRLRRDHHGEAVFIRNGGWILVINDSHWPQDGGPGHLVVATVYQATGAGRWW